MTLSWNYTKFLFNICKTVDICMCLLRLLCCGSHLESHRNSLLLVNNSSKDFVTWRGNELCLQLFAIRSNISENQKLTKPKMNVSGGPIYLFYLLIDKINALMPLNQPKSSRPPRKAQCKCLLIQMFLFIKLKKFIILFIYFCNIYNTTTVDARKSYWCTSNAGLQHFIIIKLAVT